MYDSILTLVSEIDVQLFQGRASGQQLKDKVPILHRHAIGTMHVDHLKTAHTSKSSPSRDPTNQVPCLCVRVWRKDDSLDVRVGRYCVTHAASKFFTAWTFIQPKEFQGIIGF
jgi:hypothetical protein